jgi:hypothetical protein
VQHRVPVPAPICRAHAHARARARVRARRTDQTSRRARRPAPTERRRGRPLPTSPHPSPPSPPRPIRRYPPCPLHASSRYRNRAGPGRLPTTVRSIDYRWKAVVLLSFEPARACAWRGCHGQQLAPQLGDPQSAAQRCDAVRVAHDAAKLSPTAATALRNGLPLNLS